MTETIETIATWAAETFGPAEPLRVVVRTMEELTEMLRAMTAGAPAESVVEEAADVAIVLARELRRQGWTRVSDSWREDPFPHSNRSSFEHAMQALHHLIEVALDLHWRPDEIAPVLRTISLIVVDEVAKVAADHGAPLWPAVEAKMVVNRGRAWHVDSKGVGYHVREKGA